MRARERSLRLRVVGCECAHQNREPIFFMPFSSLDDDGLLCVLRCVAEPADLARCRAVCAELRRQADSESLWERHCNAAGLSRNGSARPTSRTYCSWRQTWLDARCHECGSTYAFKVNLDGGSSMASIWHGAKVPLCSECACAAVYCYRQSATSQSFTHMPRIMARYAPEGVHVARICGRNLESSLRGAGISYDKWHARHVRPKPLCAGP